MKYGGIPEQSSNVMMSLVPNPRSSFVPSSELPLKCRSVMKSHLLNKEEMPMLVAIEKLEKISKGLHPRWLLIQSMESSITQPLVSG